MRTIKTCPGIGDFLWVAAKLVNAHEQFHFQISSAHPQRGKQVFDLLPQICASCTYVPNLPYAAIAHRNINKICKLWRTIRTNEFYLSANEHLEHGRRIEEFLPDLPTSYRLEYATTQKDESLAMQCLMTDARDIPAAYIGIYGSAYSTQRAWKLWSPQEWFEFIKLILHANPHPSQPLVFVIIGASFDIDLAGDLMVALDQAGIRYINTIGRPLSVVIEVLKRLDYFVGFPSGLSILNESLGKNGWMFYPGLDVAPHVANIMNTWAHPDRIKSGEYKGALPCPPEDAFKWIVNEYKLFDRL